MAVSVRNVPEETVDPGELRLLQDWNERREQAVNDRRRYEPTWTLCKMFLAGRQWVGIHPRTGRVISDANFEHRERHTVNVLDQYMQTMLGKLFVEDLRPQILFARDDIESQTVTEHTRAVAKYLWDTELNADPIIFQMLLKQLTYGTAAMRCFYDPSKGSEIGDFPLGPDGYPILDIEQARTYVAQLAEQGQTAQFHTMREGKVSWEALGPGNVLPPPGVENETHFPWLIVERAFPVQTAQLRWPQVAHRIHDEPIRALDQLDAREMAESPDAVSGSPGGSGRLKDHLVVSVGYEMPSPEFQRGRVITWNAHSNVLLQIDEQLPYMLHGEPHHGIVFFHYHRIPGRFWSLGMIEPLIGPQRQRNRARSQMIELKDRNLGRVYAKKGTISVHNKPVGKIMELIEIPLHADYPQETTGTPVGPWIENEARLNDEDMDRVAGLREVSMGQAPTGVSAYSAMALLAEQDERRVANVLKMLRKGLGDSMLLSLELARRYWQQNKQLAIAGPEGIVEFVNYTRAQLPEQFHLDVAGGTPLPTSPAVESQKIFDIFNAATSAGQPLPVDWLKDSLDQGKALPLPKREEQVQIAKAEQENLMMLQGIPVTPSYFDDDFIHISVHREAQSEASITPGMEQYAMQLEMHIQMHAQNAAAKKPVGAGSDVPAMQGGHGLEAQNGMVTSQEGLAQSASGDAPLQQPQG